MTSRRATFAPWGPGGGAWWDGEPIVTDLCEDGLVRLPDGQCARVELLSGHGPSRGVIVGQGAPPASTTTPIPPYQGGTTMPAAGMTGTAPANPSAESVDANWQALNAFVGKCAQGKIDAATLAQFQQDAANWMAFYSTYAATSGPTGILYLVQWENLAGDWADRLRGLCPKVQTPANFPTWGVSSAIQSAETAVANAVSSPAVSSAISTVKWVVVALLVAAGIWILWPVVAHFA
jgi:hypothetical protein